MVSLLTIQHGIFRGCQAAELGIHAPGGVPAATRVLPDVYSVIPPPLTWEARLWAAIEFGGEDAALGGISAAEAYGWLPANPLRRVQVLIPHDRRQVSAGFVDVRRTRVPLWTTAHGLRVTEPARTIVALGKALPKGELVAVTAKAVQRRELRLVDVIDLAQAHPRLPGAGPALRAALSLVGGEESLPELNLTALLGRSGLPEPLRQVDIFDGRELVTTADHLWLRPFVAGYYDGRWHLAVESQDGDAMKTLRIRGLGIEPVRVMASAMRRPQVVVDAFVAAHRTASAAALPPSPRLRLRHRGVWIWPVGEVQSLSSD